ncbi:MAG: hypothetical protein J7507_01015 [Pseudoxanthomonas sp.]|nr:hypothetical protein [Pseudoxanthomonas sp.]
MDTRTKIRRHGYHLMSLASLGTLGVALIGLLLIGLPWLAQWIPQAGNLPGAVESEQMQDMGTTGRWLLSLAGLLWTLALLLPLLTLRRLGAALYRHEALSRPVAGAFGWLAHSLPIYALLSFTGSVLAAIASGIDGDDAQQFKLEFGFGGGYVFLIACLCLYSVAHLMRLATEAADDARSFV